MNDSIITVDRILTVPEYLDGIDVAVFDLDDTLYSEREYVMSGYRAVAAAYPDYPDMANDLWSCFVQRKPALDEVFTSYGMPDEKGRALGIYRAHKPDIHLYPGARDMLEKLAKAKKLAMITDGRPEGQHHKIDALGLLSLFSCVVITDELGGPSFRKPCEISYRTVSERLNCPFDRMAYVGDNLNKDFVAPLALGMRCIHFRNPEGLYYGKT